MNDWPGNAEPMIDDPDAGQGTFTLFLVLTCLPPVEQIDSGFPFIPKGVFERCEKRVVPRFP